MSADASHGRAAGARDRTSLAIREGQSLPACTDVPAKDDIASMELPLFAMRSGDRAVRCYQDARNRVEIIPSAVGAATQRDKDVLLFCVSHLVSLRNSGVAIADRTVRTTLYAILTFCRRGTSGKDYERLSDSLVRLRGTTIRTDRATGGRQQTRGFGLIESFRMSRPQAGWQQGETVEITVSEWVFNAIEAAEVLTINRAYFALRSDLARRLYEIARKYCGRQPFWRIGVAVLWRRSGSRSSLNEFRRKLRHIEQFGSLPDYTLRLDEAGDMVQFSRVPSAGPGEQLGFAFDAVLRGHRTRDGPVDNAVEKL